jgi:hypothetical protein
VRLSFSITYEGSKEQKKKNFTASKSFVIRLVSSQSNGKKNVGTFG